ncbi:MAG TPA: heparin lyase I family protein [Azospirillaceae bacterium]|nr:heparin lyase I family protein [Azospirillaceae bacterium]
MALTNNRAGLVYEADFNTNTDLRAQGLVASGNPTAKVVDIAGEKAVKIHLDHFKDPISYRTEVTLRNLPKTDFHDGAYAHMNERYLYGLKTYMPADWEKDSSNEIITQWHEIPDWGRGEGWRNPPVALQIVPTSDGDAHFQVRVRHDSDPVTKSGSYDSDKVYDLGSIKGAIGKWTDWVWDVTWAHDDRGQLTLFRDGKKVLDLPNSGNMYNDEKGPYFKLGEYKWAWQSDKDTGADSRTLYYDDIRVANKTGNYDSVAPTPSGTGSTGGATPTPTPTPTPAGTPIKGTSANDVLQGTTGGESIYGEGGNDTLYGGLGNDGLYGYTGNDLLFGQNGDDRLVAQDGDDRMFGGMGNDQLFGGPGNDFLKGEDGNDVMYASIGNDTLWGSGGTDSLFGGDGIDLIQGGVGNDVLAGGSGNDVFHFDGLFGNDVISDFTKGADVLDLTRAGFTRSQISTSQTAGGTMVAVKDHGSILLQNVTGFTAANVLV